MAEQIHSQARAVLCASPFAPQAQRQRITLGSCLSTEHVPREPQHFLSAVGSTSHQDLLHKATESPTQALAQWIFSPQRFSLSKRSIRLGQQNTTPLQNSFK